MSSVENLSSTDIGILVLGGDLERELYALTLLDSDSFRTARLYISSGDLDASDLRISQLVVEGRCVINREAVDTLTNFTCVGRILQNDGIHEVYVVTSPSHSRRATHIARVVFGYYRIAFSMFPVPWETPKRSESWLRVVRDMIRSYIWLVTGWTAESLTTWFHPSRRANRETSTIRNTTDA